MLCRSRDRKMTGKQDHRKRNWKDQRRNTSTIVEPNDSGRCRPIANLKCFKSPTMTDKMRFVTEKREQEAPLFSYAENGRK